MEMDDTDTPEGRAPLEPTRLPGAPAHPRGNALRHGLTATTLLDEVLGADACSRTAAALREELQPNGLLEEALVGRIAHGVGALELCRRAEWAALREGARQSLALSAVQANSPDIEISSHAADAVLAATVSSEVLERIASYGRTHERSLLACVAKLQELKQARAAQAVRSPALLDRRDGDPSIPLVHGRESSDARRIALDPPWAEQIEADRFCDDASCQAYLECRMRGADYRCPACGAARGYWLAQRRRWECQACRKQAGPRTGTVMAGSPLRLCLWFRAIQAVLARGEPNVVELARLLHIRRLPTVRSMLKKIGEASASPHRSRLLAGLDSVFSIGLPEAAVPERSVLTGPFFENKS